MHGVRLICFTRGCQVRRPLHARAAAALAALGRWLHPPERKARCMRGKARSRHSEKRTYDHCCRQAQARAPSPLGAGAGTWAWGQGSRLSLTTWHVCHAQGTLTLVVQVAMAVAGRLSCRSCSNKTRAAGRAPAAPAAGTPWWAAAASAERAAGPAAGVRPRSLLSRREEQDAGTHNTPQTGRAQAAILPVTSAAQAAAAAGRQGAALLRTRRRGGWQGWDQPKTKAGVSKDPTAWWYRRENTGWGRQAPARCGPAPARCA
jgi:hypothetical protein